MVTKRIKHFQWKTIRSLAIKNIDKSQHFGVANLMVGYLYRILHYLWNEETRDQFFYLGKGRRNYTIKQKDYAFSLINTYGVRASSRILEIPRRTIQRWCRNHGLRVRRCPAWVYNWAERRRKRREFWQRRGYY